MKVRRVVQHFGGISAFAKAIRITRQAVYDWQAAQGVEDVLDTEIPWHRACQVEVVTKGALRAGQMPPLDAA